MNLDDYFEWFAQADDAIYWNSADRKTTILGLGISDSCQTTDVSTLKAWQAQQAVPVFGGISFDADIPANQQALLSGFVAPQVVLDFQHQVILGDATYLDQPLKAAIVPTISRIIIQENPETDWSQRVSEVIATMIQDPTKQKTVLGAQKSITLSAPLDQARLLKALNQQQQTSYHVAFKRAGTLFISATPERLVAVKAGEFATAAVAGSTPRGKTAASDAQLGQALLLDDKNRQEHALVVNEIVTRVRGLADVTWTDTPQLLKTPQIQHLYTPITGTLHANQHILDVVNALHPTPALGGVPRAWAMATIKQVEWAARGLFAAPFGMIWPNGDGEFVIGIRAMVVTDKTATLFAGAGILAASEAEQEWAEINLKMSPMSELIKEQLHG